MLLSGWASCHGQTVEEILARVQSNTGQFETSLPDFVCDEKVTSRDIEKNGLVEVVIESHFAGLQKETRKLGFTEHREIVTLNGKPARKNQKFEGPFLFDGGFSAILHETFSAKNVPSQTYKIAGEEMLAGKPAIVIEFATREGQKELYITFYGKTLVQKDVGKAWVDKQTLQLLRLERHFLNVPKGESPILSTVEYGEVQIDGKSFWMPSVVRSEQAQLKGARSGEYRAEYTNYRKFEVSSGIVFSEK
jgi:hypothetical protein